MSGTLAWMVVALGLLVPVVRRRSFAVALVTVQALLLAAKAFEDASTRGEIGAALALGARAVALAALFSYVVSRTREPRPVRAGAAPLVRAGAAIGLALALIWLIPQLGLGSRSLERAVLALVAFGLVTAATRRATLFQVLGIVLVENGLALAALRLPGGSALIEFGVAFDLLLVALVAVVFHERIFAEFGAGDTAHLRSLRDHP
jgi:hydrogenase-4 membrane subunit HyfE